VRGCAKKIEDRARPAGTEVGDRPLRRPALARLGDSGYARTLSFAYYGNPGGPSRGVEPDQPPSGTMARLVYKRGRPFARATDVSRWRNYGLGGYLESSAH